MPTEEEKNIFLESLKKDPKTPDPLPKKKMSGTALFASLFLIFLLIVTLLIFVMAVGGERNPILQSFGIESGEVKVFLQSLVNWTFGTLVIVLLLLFAIGLFRGLTFPKEEKQRRRTALVFGFVSGGLIFAVVLAWLAVFAYITRLPAGALNARNAIEVLNIELGEPIIAPLTISFSAARIERELERLGKSIRRFTWDRDGDGVFEVDSGKDPLVNLWFTEQGRQVVRLQVELENEAPQIFEVEFVIDAVVFAATPASGPAPLKVEFDAREVTQDLNVKSFEWDFENDGTFEESAATSLSSHIFTAPGVFPVKLRVILQDGRVLEFEREITVTGATSKPLSAAIQAEPQQGSAPLTVKFSGQGSTTVDGEIQSFNWEFPGGVTRRGENTEYTFAVPGTYRVSLTIKNDQELVDTATTEVIVSAKKSAPVPRVRTIPGANEDGEVVAEFSPFKVQFDATETIDADNDILEFAWDFTADDIADATGEKVEYTFSTAGTFPVTLTVRDAAGNRSQEKLQVIVRAEGIEAVIAANPETGAVPLTVDFDGSKSGCGMNCRILSYAWDFGDGTPVQLTGAHTTHTYTKVGTFTVKLTVTTDGGKTATNSKIIAVRIPPLKACFTPSRSSGIAPLAVSFQDCSSGTIAMWKWDFGDGVISTARAPEHTFAQKGSYIVTLAVTDENQTTSQTSQLIEVK